MSWSLDLAGHDTCKDLGETSTIPNSRGVELGNSAQSPTYVPWPRFGTPVRQAYFSNENDRTVQCPDVMPQS